MMEQGIIDSGTPTTTTTRQRNAATTYQQNPWMVFIGGTVLGGLGAVVAILIALKDSMGRRRGQRRQSPTNILVGGMRVVRLEVPHFT